MEVAAVLLALRILLGVVGFLVRALFRVGLLALVALGLGAARRPRALGSRPASITRRR